MTQGGIYQVRVWGQISERWAHWFEDMTIGADTAGTTVLSGPVADQAALLGLLQKLYTLGMPLLSVRRVEPGKAEARRRLRHFVRNDKWEGNGGMEDEC